MPDPIAPLATTAGPPSAAPAASGPAPGPKAKKVRKGQSEDQFLQQKAQFEQSGPLLNTADWLYDDLDLDKTKKTDRVKILHACEKAYYNRDYVKCMEIVKKGEELFEVELDEATAQQTREQFETSGKKIRKSAKVERHVVDLLYIKEKCLAKMAELSHTS